MAQSEAAICNSALGRIGAAKISSLDDTTVEGLLCKQHYPLVLAALLRSHPWKFARKRAALAADAVAPAWGYGYSYQLPNDCLRVLKVDGDETFPWTVEGKAVLTDSNDANILYISSSVEPGNYDSTFCEALAAELARVMSYSLTENASLRSELAAEAQAKMREARSFNGQEGAGDRVYADTWLNSRS